MSEIILLTLDRDGNEYDSRAAGVSNFSSAFGWAAYALQNKYPDSPNFAGAFLLQFQSDWNAIQGTEMAVPTVRTYRHLEGGMIAGLIYRQA